MGVVVSLFGNTGRTDDPDPVTGLTSRDKYLITTSWAEVRKKPSDNGVALLMLFFETYPNYLQLFPFKDIPLKDLPENKRFQAHCVSVVYGLSSIIDLLNENDLLIASLKKLGETHHPRGVNSQGFTDLRKVVIDLFSTFMTKPQIDAWNKMLDVAFPIVIQGINS